MRTFSVAARGLALLGTVSLVGCGGGGSRAAPSNPLPTLAAISPNSSKQGNPGFTLSVVGSNFVASSTVQWNASTLPTTFVNNSLLTANVPASAVATPGPDTIAVVNPGPGGGTSGSLAFAVPCVIASAAPASTQTRARLGAYYFDGWSGPLTSGHFQGLPLGPYQDRQP